MLIPIKHLSLDMIFVY